MTPGRAAPTYTSRRARIEQAIARGESFDWILDRLCVETTELEAVLRRLDMLHFGRDVAPVQDEEAFDEVMVERMMAGLVEHRPYDRSPERGEALRRLVDLGLNDSEIGRRFRTTHSSVCMMRRRAGISPAVPRAGSGDEPSWFALTRSDSPRRRQRVA